MNQRKPLDDFLTECQLFANIGEFIVFPDIVTRQNGRRQMVFAMYLIERDSGGVIVDKPPETPPDSIIYEDYTPENIRLSAALFPDFEWDHHYGR